MNDTAKSHRVEPIPQARQYHPEVLLRRRTQHRPRQRRYRAGQSNTQVAQHDDLHNIPTLSIANTYPRRVVS